MSWKPQNSPNSAQALAMIATSNTIETTCKHTSKLVLYTELKESSNYEQKTKKNVLNSIFSNLASLLISQRPFTALTLKNGLFFAVRLGEHKLLFASLG